MKDMSQQVERSLTMTKKRNYSCECATQMGNVPLILPAKPLCVAGKRRTA